MTAVVGSTQGPSPAQGKQRPTPLNSHCDIASAGKSSVLQALLGKMTLQKGSVHTGGQVAYVPQSPWVQNLSLRENILFGLPFDEEKYQKVIHAAALELDLKILPKGESVCVV